jgi:hypothetical protein
LHLAIGQVIFLGILPISSGLFSVFYPTATYSQTESNAIIISAPRRPQEAPSGNFVEVIEVSKRKGRKQQLREILQQYSGVYISSGPSAQGGDAFSVRGFSSQQVKILLDGVPLAHAGRSSQVDINSIPIDIIDKVVVMRGASNSFGGDASMGGVINIVTKKGAQKSQGTLSYNSLQSVSASVQSSNAELLSGPWPLQSSGVFYVKQEKGLLPHSEAQNVGGKLGFSGPAQSQLNLIYDFKNYQIPGQRGQYFEAVFEKDQNFQAQLSRPFKNIFYAGNDVEVMAFLQADEKKYFDEQGELTGFSDVSKTKDLKQGVKVASAWPITAFWHSDLTLNASREHYRKEKLSKQRKELGLEEKMDFFVTETTTLSPHVYWLKDVNDGDNHDFNDNTYTSYGLSLRQELVKQEKAGFDLALLANRHTGFRRPTFEELYLSRGFTVGNAALVPERSVGGDLGLQWKVGRVGHGQVSVFSYEMHDLIDYYLVSGFQYKPFNFSRVETRGLEWQHSLSFYEFVTWEMALTLQRVENKDENGAYRNLKIPGRPNLYGFQKLIFHLPKEIDVYGEWVTAQNRYINRSNTKKLKDRHLINLGLLWPTSIGQLTFEMKNLMNEANQDVRNYPLAGRTFYGAITKNF